MTDTASITSVNSGRDAVVDFIKTSLRPVIAVLSSYDVEALSCKNNLSFCDMLLPFSQLNVELSLKDPVNQSITNNIKNLSLDFRDMRKEGFLLSSVILPQIISESVKSVPAASSDVLPENCQWYEAFSDAILRWLEPMEHEFLRHYLACILVVSTNHQDPLDQLTKLSQSQHSQQHKTGSSPILSDIGGGPAYAATAKWFLPNIFKYHVLIHDVTTGDDKKAESVYQSMKMSYGAHACHLLRINSNSSNVPSTNDVHSDLWSSLLQQKYRGFDVGLKTAKLNSTAFTNSAMQSPVSDNESTMANGQMDPSPIPGNEDGRVTVQMTLGETELTVGETTPNPGHRFRSESVPHALSDTNLELVGLDYCSPTNEWPHVESKSSEFHGKILSVSDRDRIGVFVQEFATRGLMPFVERQMRLLNDQCNTRNRPVRGIISVTKKWFGSSSSLAPTSSPTVNTQNTQSHVTYTQESSEMQARRLADLAFLFQQYNLAFVTYQNLKRDFLAEQAFLYYAGALEMSSLCAFILGPNSPRPYPQHNMETAITTYLNNCRRPLLATRATLLSTRILSSMDLHHDAAAQYIRMTSNESDLSSALFLEQASLRFDRVNMVRKYALHMVLAGHRFSKAGHKQHAIRCYQLASSIYMTKGWHFAEDHINYTIGHQSLSLGNKLQAANCCSRLLYDGTEQSTQQQISYLKDYLTVLENVCQEADGSKCPDLPLPVIDSQQICVFLGGIIDSVPPHIDHDDCWRDLEHGCFVSAGTHRSPSSFRAAVSYMDNKTDNSNAQNTPINEPFTLDLPIKNPLDCDIVLLNVELECSNARSEILPELTLSPNEQSHIRLSLTPNGHLSGHSLSVTGICFGLSLSDRSVMVNGRQSLNVRGRRLNGTKENRMSVSYGPDYRLDPRVSDRSLPLLKFELSPTPSNECHCLAGELFKYELTIDNVGSLPVNKLLCSAQPSDSVILLSNSPTYEVCHNLVQSKMIWDLSSGSFDCAISRKYAIWIRAPEIEGKRTIQLLFYYENQTEVSSISRHRICRRQLKLVISKSLTLRSKCYPKMPDWSNTLVCVNASNPDQSTAQQPQITEFHLMRMALVNHSNSEWSLAKQQDNIANFPEIRLNHGEVDNLCFSVSKCDVDTKKMNEQWMSEDGQNCCPSILPWPPLSHLHNQSLFLALFWKAYIVQSDGRVRTAIGEQWISIDNHIGSASYNSFDDLSAKQFLSGLSLPKSIPFVQPSLISCHLHCHTSLVEHNFDVESMCIIPLRVHVVNGSDISQVITIKCVDVDQTYRGSNIARGCGTVEHKVSLTPNSDAHLTVTLFITNPGLYDLSNVNVMAETQGGQRTMITVPTTYVTVMDKR